MSKMFFAFLMSAVVLGAGSVFMNEPVSANSRGSVRTSRNGNTTNSSTPPNHVPFCEEYNARVSRNASNLRTERNSLENLLRSLRQAQTQLTRAERNRDTVRVTGLSYIINQINREIATRQARINELQSQPTRTIACGSWVRMDRPSYINYCTNPKYKRVDMARTTTFEGGQSWEWSIPACILVDQPSPETRWS